MKRINNLLLILYILSGQVGTAQSSPKQAIIEDKTYFSGVFNEIRHCRLILPPDYHNHPGRKYPVIYFFHGNAGRYSGPENGQVSISGEARYYDAFNGNFQRTGPDSLDNFSTFVCQNDVIIAKWDGFVPDQYPRPYNIGPVRGDRQFTDYFPEFVRYIDDNYRTTASREGRAVSGLSMGGFMSLLIASKYPHLISSASFFCPSAAFTIGPKELQSFTEFKEMGRSFIGLPIRMHIGSNDFLRQHDRELDQAFRTLELYYESWQYGENYFDGFHNAVNIKGQFDFHMKYFRMPYPKPEKWYHTDVFPDFEIWNYTFSSNRDKPGYTLIDEVNKEGFKLQTKKWLPDGPALQGVTFELTTDTLYMPDSEYEFIMLDNASKNISREKIESDSAGKLHLKWQSDFADIGIYRSGDPGYISMADYTLDKRMPSAWEEVEFTPFLFNKGGQEVDSIEVELIPQDEDVEVLTTSQSIVKIARGELHQRTTFKIRSRNSKLDRAKLRLMVQYEGRKDQFLLEVPFYSPESDLNDFVIADGRKIKLEVEDDTNLGEGNGNGIANPGEWISVLAQSDQNDTVWYGLKLYTVDPYVDMKSRKMHYFKRKDWSGTMRPTSEIHISPECPDRHQIQFYGIYEFPTQGNTRRDNQAAMSFIHETKRVSFTVEVKE